MEDNTRTRTSDSETQSVFPLPLSPFEEYMVKDNHRAYPMVFTIRLLFAGSLDQTRLEQALKVALARHPLLCSTIERIGRNRHRWHWHSELPVDLAVEETAVSSGDLTGLQRSFPQSVVPPLSEKTGLRARILRHAHSKTDTLTVQFHHVCCDGGGAFQFLTDVLVAYHYGGDSVGPHLDRLDATALRRRHRRRLSWLQRLALIPQQGFGIEGARQFFVRRPQPLVDQSWPDLQQPPPEDFPIVVVGELSAAELTELDKVARSAAATTHELMTRELFLTIRDFHAQRGQLAERKWLRLNIPMSLRRPEHQVTSAANIVTMVFLDRKPRHMGNERRLLSGIHAEMSRIKRFDVKYAYLYFAQLIKWIPGGFELVSRSRKCHATMVLTNLGSAFANVPLPTSGGLLKSHNVALQSVDLSAPYRPLCNAAVALVNYGGRMTINLHFDPRALSHQEAKSLLDSYVARLQRMANAANR